MTINFDSVLNLCRNISTLTFVMNDIKERLKIFADYSGLSIRRLEEICSLRRGAFSGKSDSIKSVSLSNLIDTCQDLNINWLLNGKGNMLNDSSQETDNNKKNETIEVSAEAWNIIKTQAEVMSLQAKSLSKRDTQIDDLINMLKKGIAPPEDTAGCADAVV